jgi:hypothetical protein
MSTAFIPDLQASHDLRCGLTIRISTGDVYVTSVKDLNEHGEYVVVYDPQVLRDFETTTVMLVSDIVAVTLHPDMPWPHGST